MKIAIFPSYGSAYIPPFLQNQLKEADWIRNRILLAKLVSELEPTHDVITQEVYNAYSSHEPNELNFFDYIKDKQNPEIVFVKELEKKYGWVYQIKIEEVDTSILWRIGENDGAEGIEYYSDPVIVDKELNYGNF